MKCSICFKMCVTNLFKCFWESKSLFLCNFRGICFWHLLYGFKRMMYQYETCRGLVEAVSDWMTTAWQQNKFLHYKLTTLNTQPCACFLCTISSWGMYNHALRFRGCRPKWPLRSYETRLPTLPYIVLRVINYAGKLLALRGKTAATIWRQPQFLSSLFHTCCPATAFRIHCNAFKVSILHL